jgi:hypothetical protein
MDPFIYTTFGFIGTPTTKTMTIRNNIFWIRGFWFVYDEQAQGEIGHDHNLFYLPDSASKVGFALGQGERVADPSFVNLTKLDLHLQQNSPAIGTGVGGMDLGAFAYQR